MRSKMDEAAARRAAAMTAAAAGGGGGSAGPGPDFVCGTGQYIDGIMMTGRQTIYV